MAWLCGMTILNSREWSLWKFKYIKLKNFDISLNNLIDVQTSAKFKKWGLKTARGVDYIKFCLFLWKKFLKKSEIKFLKQIKNSICITTIYMQYCCEISLICIENFRLCWLQNYPLLHTLSTTQYYNQVFPYPVEHMYFVN